MADNSSSQDSNGSSSGKEVSNKVLTLPNAISAIRLCLVPVFFVLLMGGHDLLAAFIFALAAGTDWIDGQIARKTHAVTRLGQLLDPAVDRILMIAGVLGLALIGRLPLWIIVLVIARDLFLLVGGMYLLGRYRTRIDVVFLGKVATTLLFIGFAGLLLNWPLVPGLALTDAAWLPGCSAEPVSWGIWFVYCGLVCALATTLVYLIKALRRIRTLKESAGQGIPLP